MDWRPNHGSFIKSKKISTGVLSKMLREPKQHTTMLCGWKGDNANTGKIHNHSKTRKPSSHNVVKLC